MQAVVFADAMSNREIPPSPLAVLCDEHDLTPRESEVVILLAQGFTNKEIATHMQVSVNTVKAFVRSVMLKLDVTTRAGILGRLFEQSRVV